MMQNNNDKIRVAFYTLGCKLNFAETSTIARQFSDDNFTKVEFEEQADVYVINTCSVTEVADKKCRYIIKKAHRQNPGAMVVVVGCYAQLKPEIVASIPGVDLVLGANEKFNISEYIAQIRQTADKSGEKKAVVMYSDIEQLTDFFPSYSYADRTRSFLKVQDGCDYICSYCTIPKARGKSRNSHITNVISEAEIIAAAGVREVVLTGVNIGDFGKSTGESLEDLIKLLDLVQGIERFRISSIEPNLLTDNIIEFVARSKRFVPHFHIPLQSGTDKILALMKRRYKRELYAKRVEQIRAIMPLASIGVDVIVGFPGETEADFLETYHFLNEMAVSYIHVFTYSERPGTEATALPGVVAADAKARRSKMLNVLSAKKQRMFYEMNKGRTATVLFEAGNGGDKMHGFTENYIKVVAPFDNNQVNKVVDVVLRDINAEGDFEIDFV